MQTITVEITHNNALKALHSLEDKNYIRIVDEEVNLPSLQGRPLSLKEFKNWIKDAENSGSIDLTEAKSKWKNKRMHLMNPSR